MNYSILNLQILPLMIKTAGKDLWISTLLSSMVGLFIGLLLWSLDKRNPEQTWFEMMQHRPGGRTLIWLIVPVVILYLWVLCILTSISLTEFISIGFVQETPFWVIATAFGVSITYTLRNKLSSLADLSGLFTLIAIITGPTMSLALIGKRHLNYLLPIAEHGITPILLGAALFIPIWTELFLLGFIHKKSTKKGGWFKAYFWIVVINTIIFVGHSEGAISTFGLGQAENMNFPMLSAVKAISLGFIDRFDVYGLILMLFGAFIRVAMYYQLSLELIGHLFKNRKVRVSLWIKVILSAVLLSTTTVFLFTSTVFFRELLQPFLRFSFLMLGLFLVLYLYLRFGRAHQTRF